MGLNTSPEESRKMPMTALFDVVFLLILFFILTSSIVAGGKESLGVKRLETPRAYGKTLCSMIVQIYEFQNRTYCTVFNDREIGLLEALGPDSYRSKTSFIDFAGPYLNPVPVSDVGPVLRAKLNNSTAGMSGKSKCEVVIRAEYDISYADVITVVDQLFSEAILKVATIEYVLLVGPLVDEAGEKGLGKIARRGDPPPPPPQVPSDPTSKVPLR